LFSLLNTVSTSQYKVGWVVGSEEKEPMSIEELRTMHTLGSKDIRLGNEYIF
jgi:hypothetical protein